MTLVKGRNGQTFDIPEAVATGLIKSGRVELVGPEAPEETTEGTEGEQAPAEVATATTEAAAEGEPATDGDAPAAPAGNATTEAWAEYALALGFAEEQLDGLTREGIKELINK